jgi:phospholipid/cholesterol/gamma-HCH transport system substrate-binding protein
METNNPARIVGLFVAVCLAIIAVLLLQFGKGSSLFKRGYHVIVKSANVGGLKSGASVMVSGVAVGKVSEIRLAQDGRSVLIYCWIPSDFRIYSDATFEIEQSGFLGDQFVSVLPDKNLGQLLKDGDIVSAQQPFNVQEAARKAVELMEKLDSAAAKIDGAVERVDTTLLSDDSLGGVAETLKNLNQISSRADLALSDIQLLVKENGPAIGTTISNLNHFALVLSKAVGRVDALIETNEGSVRTILTELESGSGDVRKLAGQARELADDLQSGQGVLGGLLQNDTWKTQVGQAVQNLTLLSSNLTQHGLLYKPPKTSARTNSWFRGRTPFR